jgi:hypothetical protein
MMYNLVIVHKNCYGLLLHNKHVSIFEVFPSMIVRLL